MMFGAQQRARWVSMLSMPCTTLALLLPRFATSPMSAFAEIPPARRSPDVNAAIERGAEFFLERKLLHEGHRFPWWYWLRYPWHYFYDVLVGLDFMTALGYGEDPRMREALEHLLSKRRSDGRWALDHTNGDMRLEPTRRPSKMITFLALRVLRRAGRRGGLR